MSEPVGPPVTASGRAPGLPLGTAVVLDVETVVYDDGSVYGGSPGRLLRFDLRGVDAFTELREGLVRTPTGGSLGRRLSDIGVVHPRPSPGLRDDQVGTVTVVVPVRDRVVELDRCLAALSRTVGGAVARVVVVDDGSSDADGVADVARVHGADLVRREENGGPGPARNSGLEAVTTPYVAFCDSDCVPEPRWVDELVGHLDDPLVAAAAPRVVAVGDPPRDLAERFSRHRSPLDLGERPARVAPMSRVSYVPTAALLLRVSALERVEGPAGFDPGLRYGEDVDLVWRLVEAGWRVRYDPAVEVGHVEPSTWSQLLRRRFAYGTSAALLEDRHPGAVSPLVLVASPAVTVAALLARRPLVGAAAFAAGYAEVATALRRNGLPVKGVPGPLLRGVQETFFGAGHWVSQMAPGLAVAALVAPGRSRSAWLRRAAVVGLVLAPPVRDWLRARPPVDVVRWTAGVLADDAAYGAGVWAGSRRSGHLRAVLPRVRRNLIAGIERTRP